MKHRLLTVFAAVLAALCLPFSGILSARAAGAADAGTSFAPATLAPSALLAMLTGDTIGEAESKFLDSKSDLFFTYEDMIPPELILCRPEGDRLRVTADIYQTADGIVWTPAAATLNGQTLPLTEDGGHYTALFPAGDADTAVLSVRYTATLTIETGLTETLCRYAYTEGTEAAAMRGEDNAAHARYIAAAAAYAEYCAAKAAYEADLARYHAYLDARRAYEQACSAYDAYLAEMETYRRALEDYVAYQEAQSAYEKENTAYGKALAEAAVSEDAYRAYLAYLNALSDCRARLQVMAYLSNSSYGMHYSLGGAMFSDILAHRTELIAAGCSAEDFDTLSGEVIRLRALLDDYRELTDEESQYAFYRAHYAELKRMTADLAKAMYSLFGNRILQAELNNRGKTKRYLQMAAQFYILSAWMDDSVTLDEDYGLSVTLAGQNRFYNLAAMLYGISPIPEDTNKMDPTEHAYPAPVENPLPDMTPPEKPVAVRRPVLPDEVPPPGDAPAAVKAPQEPEEVTDPGKEPAPRVTDPLLLSLADAVEAGDVREHSLPGARKIAAESTVSRGVSRQGHPVVSFYDADGRTLLAFVTTPAGGEVAYPKEWPFRERDDTYTYTFSGFVTADGREASLTAVTGDTAVYATYRRAERQDEYTVRFDVDGIIYETTCTYRTLPVCPVSTGKASDAQWVYTFVGWDSPLLPVTGDVTYKAQYASAPRPYDVTFSSAAGETTAAWQYGETPTPPAVADYMQNGILYRFSGWDPIVGPVTGETIYTARYTETVLLPLPDGGVGDVARTDSRTLTVTTAGGRLSLAALLSYAAEGGDRVAVRLMQDETLFAGIAFSADDVAALRKAGVTDLVLMPTDGAAAGTRACLLLSFGTGDGGAAAPAGLSCLLTFPYAAIDGEDAEIYRLQEGEENALFASYRDGALSARLPAAGCYALIERFPVSVSVNGKWNGAVSPDRYRAAAGEWVTLAVQPGIGNRLLSLTILRRADGAAVAVDENGRFQMPADGVTITAEFTPMLCTVRFVRGNELIDSGAYRRGDTVTAPILPAYTDADGVRWLFSGWSPAFSSIVTDDVTYTAVFRQATVPSGSGRNNNRLLTIYLPAAGGTVLLVVGAVLFFRCRRKRRK